MYLKTDSQSPGIHRASWRSRGAIWGGWLTVRPAALTPGKRLGTRCTGGWVDPLRLGAISHSSGFEFCRFYPLTSRTDFKGYRLRYPGRHYHRTTSNHILLTKLKNFCTLWCWFNLDVFFMDSCFSGIKWETLTYLERCEGNCCFRKWKTYQS